MERYDKKERHSNSDKELEQPAAPDAAQIPSALRAWGWTEEWEQKAHDALEARVAGAGGLTDSLVPARVIQHVHHTYELVVAPTAECVTAEVTGAFAYRVATPAEYPTVGDWVLMDPEGRRIHTVLPRRTAIRPSAAGNETLEQVITANTDILFLVFGLDGGRNFTVGLLERSLVTAWNSGSRPLVVLNKADCAAPEAIESARLEAEWESPHCLTRLWAEVRHRLG